MKIRITKSSKKANKEIQSRLDREYAYKKLYKDIRENGCPSCHSKNIYIRDGIEESMKYDCGCWDCRAEWTARCKKKWR